MALHNFTEQELALPFSMTYTQFCTVIKRVQIAKAKRQATKAERANRTLTTKQKLIAWTQLGGIVQYKAISYTTHEGQGIVFVNSKPYAINATFGDLISLCKKVYGLDGTATIQVLHP